jgi:putative endonuclease
MNTVERGKQGEDLAAVALTAYSYQVVERNWRCQSGEIDLVAREEETWVFVEVKLRQGQAFGTPEEAVTPAKQERVLRAAEAYLAEHELTNVSWRIDVVAIELASSGRVKRLSLHRDAVRADG